ncbi:hypothetical protein THAOC_31028 [Thalassiosira oceanica]|uniref:PDZ domain-containing protein n=1 Tax=Thalassiosira oceanica TaxID=159749 RepID=K0RA53_THAOC|nr:hypothetical protein THAOC_31028 [Thalassiosira oceanica]|eukprot:EJK50045.1 hypothetical protein THAOC_31028 [Thalassiosira oceanica]
MISSSCEGDDGHNDFHTWASEAVFLRLSSLSRMRPTSNVVDDEDCNGDECNGSSHFYTWASERVFSCLPGINPPPVVCKERLPDFRRISKLQDEASRLDVQGNAIKDVASHESSSVSSIVVSSRENNDDGKPGNLQEGVESREPSSATVVPLYEKDERLEPADENDPSAVARSNSSPEGVFDELPSFDEWATGAVFKNMGIGEGGGENGETQYVIGNSVQQRRRTKQEFKIVLGHSSSEPPTQANAGAESIVSRNLCPDWIIFEDWAGAAVFNNLSKTVLGTDTDTDTDINGDMVCTVGGAAKNPDEVDNVTRREVSFNEWADEVVFKSIPSNNIVNKNILSNRRDQCNNSPSPQPLPAATLVKSIAAQNDVGTNGDGSVMAKSLKLFPSKEVTLEQSHPSSEEEKLFIPETASTRSTFEEWATSVIFGGMNAKEKSSEVCNKSLPLEKESKSNPAEQAHLKSDTCSETEHFGTWASSVVFNGIDARQKPKDEPSGVDKTHLHQNGIKTCVQDEDKSSSLDCAANCVKSRDEEDTSRGGSDRSEEPSTPLNPLMESPLSRIASTRHGSRKGLQDEVASHKSVGEMNVDFGQADGSNGLELPPKSQNLPNCTRVDEGERTISNLVDNDSLKNTQSAEDDETHKSDESKIAVDSPSLAGGNSDGSALPKEGTVYGHKAPQDNQLRDVYKKDAVPKSALHSLPVYIRFDYLIPRVISVSAVKARLEDRVGLVFVDRGHKIILSKMTSRSLYLHSELSVGDELLTVNNHRVKNAKKAAEFIRLTQGPLRLVTFTGKRPRESSLVMLRRNSFNPSDVWLANRNGMVHVVKARGKFGRSIRDGDVLLSVDGHTVLTATRASELLSKPEGSDPEAGQIAIILVFSLAKLRTRVAKKLGRKLPFTWSDDYSEGSLVHSGTRLVKIHDDGNVESLSRLGIGAPMLDEIEAFATSFYDCFQQAMDSLNRALVDAARENATTIPHSHSC